LRRTVKGIKVKKKSATQDDLRQENGKIMCSKMMKHRSDGGAVSPKRARPFMNLPSLILLLLLVSSFSLPADNVPDRLPRTNLLVYHDGKGRVSAVKSKRDWEKRRAEILNACQRIMGPLPGKERRCSLDVKTESEKDRGSYLERFINYASEPNSRVAAYLLIPKTILDSKRNAPAILALHPTDMEYGQKVVVEELRRNYRAYGRDLAERGYVVLAPAYPLMANYRPDLKALGYQSGTMKAIWDNMRGLDLLESLPFVDKGRFAAIGHSLGGHNAIYTAVFDKRIKVIVSSCGFDSFVDYKDGDIRGWTSERYMPKLLEFRNRLNEVPFDFSELLGALAPRPVFINAPLGDGNFKWRSVDEMVRAATPIYELWGAKENLHVEHPDCAHDFPGEIRAKAYAFLDEQLNYTGRD
jgi:dienelactone hydrolase